MSRLAVLGVVMLGCGRVGFDALAPDADRPADDAPSTVNPSCAQLAATCGSTGDRSCCERRFVPGGSFARSYDVAADGRWASMQYSATLSAFELDTFEVTIGRFRAFVDAGAGTQAAPPADNAGVRTGQAMSGWSSAWNASLASNTVALRDGLTCPGGPAVWTNTPAARENAPINCVTWFEALAFCIWDGGTLPSEAEWNFAASGGDEHRAYPWSMPPSSLVIDDTRAVYGCLGDGAPGCTAADLVVVGSRPLGDARWGHADLAGNVFEWVLDGWSTPLATPCEDCVVVVPGPERVMRGGDFGATDEFQRAARRGDVFLPEVRLGNAGFRCMRPLL